MSISLDESQLQRLVDGELDSKQRREFLMAMDNDPKHWREVALAFVEDRIWRTDVNVAAEFSGPTFDHTTVVGPTFRRQFSSKAWVALAVALLVMLVGSFRLGVLNQQARMTPNDVQGNTSHTVADDAPTSRLMVHANGEVIELPIYDESQYQRALWNPPQNERMDRLNSSLEGLGYRLELETEYLTGQIDDSRELVVPVRYVAMQYHGQ
jgi:hypothetical protein